MGRRQHVRHRTGVYHAPTGISSTPDIRILHIRPTAIRPHRVGRGSWNIEIGQLPKQIDIYQRTHRWTTGEWLPRTRERHDRMMEMQSQPPTEGSTPPIDDNIYDEVLDRSYVTGLGYRVMAPSSSRATHISCDARLNETERRHAKIERRHQEEIADLRWANAELSSQLQAFRMKLKELYRRMPPPLTFDVHADASDQDSIDDDDDASPIELFYIPLN
ncbi:hypothetical protein COCNU_scaffold000539G000010 [Cocos nucifera]|nr:hypothetical protein [Cocos nucifera]